MFTRAADRTAATRIMSKLPFSGTIATASGQSITGAIRVSLPRRESMRMASSLSVSIRARLLGGQTGSGRGHTGQPNRVALVTFRRDGEGEKARPRSGRSGRS